MSGRHARSLTRSLLLGALALVAGVALFAPTIASAAPPCPTSLAALELFAPEYGRAGSSLEIDVNANLDRQPKDATLEVSSADSETVYPLALTEAITTVVVPAGPIYPDFRLTLRWTQDEGTPTACRGEQVLTVPIVPQWATVGELGYPRLEGRFKMREQVVQPKREPPYRAIWRFTPFCDIGACGTRIKSNLTLRGTFYPGAPGNYTALKETGPRYACRGKYVNRWTGETIRRFTIRRAYVERASFRIWATKVSADGEILRFAGRTRTHWVPVGRAERIGCPDRGWVERISGRRF